MRAKASIPAAVMSRMDWNSSGDTRQGSGA
jgi:hypothetical protein